MPRPYDRHDTPRQLDHLADVRAMTQHGQTPNNQVKLACAQARHQYLVNLDDKAGALLRYARDHLRKQPRGRGQQAADHDAARIAARDILQLLRGGADLRKDQLSAPDQRGPRSGWDHAPVAAFKEHHLEVCLQILDHLGRSWLRQVQLARGMQNAAVTTDRDQKAQLQPVFEPACDQGVGLHRSEPHPGAFAPDGVHRTHRGERRGSGLSGSALPETVKSRLPNRPCASMRWIFCVAAGSCNQLHFGQIKANARQRHRGSHVGILGIGQPGGAGAAAEMDSRAGQRGEMQHVLGPRSDARHVVTRRRSVLRRYRPAWRLARVTWAADGCVRIASGSSAQGQARARSYAAIVAGALGVRPDRIDVSYGDTGTCPPA